MTNVPTWLVSINSVLVVVATLCIVASWIFVYCFRNRPIVAMGQPLMLAVLCFGALLITVGMIFQVVLWFDAGSKDTIDLDICCSLIIWLQYIGNIIILTILLCKLYRTFKVVQFRRGQKILPRHVFGPFLVIVLLFIGILIAWEIVYPIHYVIIPYPGETEDVGVGCVSINEKGSIIFETTLLVVVTLLIIGIMWLACKIRNINEEIGDSRRIFRLLLLMLINSILYNTVINIVYRTNISGLGTLGRSSIVFTANILVNFVFVMGSIGFLILPRMYYVWYERVHGHLPESVQMFGGGQVRVNIQSSNQNTLVGGNSDDGE